MYWTDSISQGTGGVLVKYAEIHLYISVPIANSWNLSLNYVLDTHSISQVVTGAVLVNYTESHL